MDNKVSIIIYMYSCNRVENKSKRPFTCSDNIDVGGQDKYLLYFTIAVAGGFFFFLYCNFVLTSNCNNVVLRELIITVCIYRAQNNQTSCNVKCVVIIIIIIIDTITYYKRFLKRSRVNIKKISHMLRTKGGPLLQVASWVGKIYTEYFNLISARNHKSLQTKTILC